MGFFSRQPVVDYWQDVPSLAMWPIAHHLQGGLWSAAAYMATSTRIPRYHIRTIQHRLAHMIFRSAQPSWGTTIVAKWYLRELDKISLSAKDAEFIRNFRTRLKRAVNDFEAKNGLAADSELDRLIEMAGVHNAYVLYGPAVWGGSQPNWLEPCGRLAIYLNAFGWLHHY
jgi:hypothetical protein